MTPQHDDLSELVFPFTGRQAIIENFEYSLSEPATDIHKIWHFWGLAGTGKTTLMSELLKRARRASDYYSVISTALDFNDLLVSGETNLQETALLALRNEFGIYKVSLPTFDIALLHYWNRCRRYVKFDKEQLVNLGLFGTIADVVKGVSDTNAERNALFKEIARLAESAALSVKIVDLALQAYNLGKRVNTESQVKSLKRLPELKNYQLLDKLTEYLVNDVSAYLTREERKLMVFIDTYDLLLGRNSKLRGWERNDQWVRSLINQFSPDEPAKKHPYRHLWVIASREQCHWPYMDDSHLTNYPEECEVSNFSGSETRQFLMQVGIRSEQLIDHLLRTSHGTPWLLKQFVINYGRIKAHREPVPADFRVDFNSVVSYVLEGLDRSESETLRFLAGTDHWDEQLFKVLVKEESTGYPASGCVMLHRQHSFIREKNGRYWLDGPLKDALEESLSDPEKKRLNTILSKYYRDRFNGAEDDLLND